MNEKEMIALSCALRAWRFKCDDRYHVPGCYFSYTLQAYRHFAAFPELGVAELACQHDQLTEILNVQEKVPQT